MRVLKMIMNKGYNRVEAEEMAHKVFDNVDNSQKSLTAEYFVSRILSKEEFEAMYS
jgi:hypothetical protein